MCFFFFPNARAWPPRSRHGAIADDARAAAPALCRAMVMFKRSVGQFTARLMARCGVPISGKNRAWVAH